MATLTVLDEQTAVQKIELAEGTLSLGRSKDNDIPLCEKTVSTHHAKIVSYLGATYIEDLNSTNGTFINGKRVRMHTLHPGDEVLLGKQRLKVDL